MDSEETSTPSWYSMRRHSLRWPNHRESQWIPRWLMSPIPAVSPEPICWQTSGHEHQRLTADSRESLLRATRTRPSIRRTRGSPKTFCRNQHAQKRESRRQAWLYAGKDPPGWIESRASKFSRNRTRIRNGRGAHHPPLPISIRLTLAVRQSFFGYPRRFIPTERSSRDADGCGSKERREQSPEWPGSSRPTHPARSPFPCAPSRRSPGSIHPR